MARASVLKDDEWSTICSIAHTNMKTPVGLYYKPDDKGSQGGHNRNWEYYRKFFKDDIEALKEKIIKILF